MPAYPAKVVRLIVPVATGGATDILARLVATRLSERMGQSFVVDNRPGATGVTGSDMVAKARADGYTLLMGSDSMLTINPHVYPNMPFDPLRSFQAVTKVADVPLLIVASPGLKATSLGDLKALAARRNAPITYASAGTGSAGHLTGEFLKSLLGVPMIHVPYKSGGQALTDVVGGEVDLLIAAIPAALSFVKSGQVKAVAVTSGRRSSALPAVPTVSESGYPGINIVSFYGLLAPAGTPMPAVRALRQEVVKILAEPVTRERLEAMGADPVGNTPEEFMANIGDDLARWGEVIKASGIQIDR
ncbi:MAG TPA: tripartite tricarboxylate transporter substrate binding protein [Ramlibacter sp.]|nr:tripartite tricarboxylate transporter substrate binding protein [Ramlibacter sp.]